VLVKAILASEKAVPYKNLTWGARPIGKQVVVGWNGSREAARAVADAMPILGRAKAVDILSIEIKETGEFLMGRRQLCLRPWRTRLCLTASSRRIIGGLQLAWATLRRRSRVGSKVSNKTHRACETISSPDLSLKLNAWFRPITPRLAAFYVA